MIDFAAASIALSMMVGVCLLVVAAWDAYNDRVIIRPEYEPGFVVVARAAAPIAVPAFKAKAQVVQIFKAKPTRKRKTKGVQTPSKFMTLAQLEKIKIDNYGGNSHEYDAEEVDRAILARSQKRADKMVFESVRKLTLADINF